MSVVAMACRGKERDVYYDEVFRALFSTSKLMIGMELFHISQIHIGSLQGIELSMLSVSSCVIGDFAPSLTIGLVRVTTN